MDKHRKLLVLGLNELLKRNLISLDGHGDEKGHIMTELYGENSVIIWNSISHEELRLSVWWKYDHSKHPQANSQGNSKETFVTTLPLAKQKHYPSFVGATVSGWIERETGKHLQGEKAQGLFSIYTRKGEKDILENIPDPVPNGFKAEGKFFF